MTFLVTGAAGFIGYHLSERLLARGERVIGIDNVNDYYSTTLKRDRIADLQRAGTFIGELAVLLAGEAEIGARCIDRHRQAAIRTHRRAGSRLDRVLAG